MAIEVFQKDDKYYAILLPALSEIDGYVQQAAESALELDFPIKDAHVLNWQAIANRYLRDPTGFTEKAKLYMYYGSAVERIAYASIRLNGLKKLPAFYTFDFEVSHGGTRPDIVIFQGTPSDGAEVAWLDITSRSSTGHITDKDGSGWKGKPVVCEILYTPLKKTNIKEKGGMSKSDMKALRARDAAYRAAINREERAFLENVYFLLSTQRYTPSSFCKHISQLTNLEWSRANVRFLIRCIAEEYKELTEGELMKMIGYTASIMPGVDRSLFDAYIRKKAGY
jgi:hypothetical protein